MFTSRNGYPLHTRNSFIKLLRNNTKMIRNDDKNNEIKIICIILAYHGDIGDKMKKRCFKKVLKWLPQIVYSFFTHYKTIKPSMFYFPSNTIPTLQKSNIICQHLLVGIRTLLEKTDRHLSICLHDHDSHDNQPIYQHLLRCKHLWT